MFNPNVECDIFVLDHDSLRVSCDQLCSKVSKYLLSINTYPTVTGATYRSMIPLLILPGCPLQETFTGIDDMNSTEAWKLRRLLIWKQEDSIATRVEWKVEKPKKPTSRHFWMHGVHVEHFEVCREHFLTWNPGAVRYITSSQHAESSAKLEHDQCCTQFATKKGHLATPGTRDLPKSWILGYLSQY